MRVRFPLPALPCGGWLGRGCLALILGATLTLQGQDTSDSSGSSGAGSGSTGTGGSTTAPAGGNSGGSSSGTNASGSSSTGASSAFGNPEPASPSSNIPPAADTGPSVPPTGAAGPVTGTGAPLPEASGRPSGLGQPSGTNLGGSARLLDTGPTSYSISTGYGKVPDIFVSGEGRLARPKFSARVSGSIGFDDNVFQTATKAQGTPDQTVQEEVSAGTAAQIVYVPIKTSTVQSIGIIGPAPKTQQYRAVLIPATDPVFQTIVIPGTPKPKRQASAILRESLGVDAQFATKRTVFTLDLDVGSDYYVNRPGKKTEYTGNLALRYLYRITPRLEFTAAITSSYQAQPDYSQINLPTTNSAGSYLTTNSKFDLSYRWTPRFTTVTSLTYNRLDYEQTTQRVSDYWLGGVGTEFRYLWSPKLTVVAEGRYSETRYPNTPALDSHSYFLLGGFDWTLNRRTQATVRLGGSVQTFEESGRSQSSPYVETTLSYQLGKASVLAWSNRFGFEEPPDPYTKLLTLRSSLNVTHSFTSRLRASLGINAIHQTSSSSLTDIDTTNDTLDTNLGLGYTMSRDWTFSLNYSYTAVFFHPGSDGDYFRDRVFAGFDYSF